MGHRVHAREWKRADSDEAKLVIPKTRSRRKAASVATAGALEMQRLVGNSATVRMLSDAKSGVTPLVRRQLPEYVAREDTVVEEEEDVDQVRGLDPQVPVPNGPPPIPPKPRGLRVPPPIPPKPQGLRVPPPIPPKPQGLRVPPPLPPKPARMPPRPPQGPPPLLVPQAQAPQLDTPANFSARVRPALRGKGLGPIRGKVSSTLVGIHKLLKEVTVPVGGDPAAKKRRLAALSELADSCEAWAKVHGEEEHRREVAVYVSEQGVAARAEVVKLKTADSTLTLAPTDYDPTKNKIVKKAQALDMKSALAKLGILIDLAVPAPGSKGEVELEVDIPIPKTPAFLGFRFKAEGDRPEPEKLKCRLELSFTGGVHIPGGIGRAAGELGGFSEAQGRNAEEVMRLFSYGLYRRSRESMLSNAELTSILWGGTTGKKGWNEAERWAGAVEKNIFGEFGDAYVQSGGFARGVAEVGLDHVGKGKLDAQIGTGKHWDAGGIKAIANAKSEWKPAKIDAIVKALKDAKPTSWRARGKVEQALAEAGHFVSTAVLEKIVKQAGKANPADPWTDEALRPAVEAFSRPGQKRRGLNEPQERAGFGETLESKAESIVYFKTSGSITAGMIKADGKVEGSWITRGRDSNLPTHFREGKIELKGGFYLPGAKQMAGGIETIFQFEKLASQAVEMVKQLPFAKSSKMGAGQRAGELTKESSELVEAAMQIGSVPMDKFDSAFKASDPIKQGLSVGSTIQLVIEAKIKAKKKTSDPLPYEIGISIGEERALKAEMVVARVKVQTFERWLKAQCKAGAWTFDVFGKQIS